MIQNKLENIEKLKNYVEQKNYDNIDILDLIKYIAIQKGAKLASNHSIETLKNKVPLKSNVLFILLDGFGYFKANSLPKTSILKEHLISSIDTVNPTSTACVLTSIFTGKYPCEHGIFGWWQYSRNLDLSYYPLLGISRKTEQKVEEEIRKIIGEESIFDKMHTKVNVYMNRNIIHSSYSKMFAGKKANNHGTYSILESFQRIHKNINDVDHGFHYLYIEGLDKTSHQYGVDSKEVMEIIHEVEKGVEELSKNHPNLTIIVTADHGQVEMTNMIYLNQTKDYTKYFYAYPSIDTRTISFFVKEEYREEFEREFCDEFSEDVILLTREETEKYHIFGNTYFSEKALDALGEYIAIVVNDKFMLCDKISLEDRIYTKGNHSGLREVETKIPLIVI